MLDGHVSVESSLLRVSDLAVDQQYFLIDLQASSALYIHSFHGDDLTTVLSIIEVIFGAYCDDGRGTRMVALDTDGDIA